MRPLVWMVWGWFLFAATSAGAADEVYHSDRFTVRKLDKVCKVEINIRRGDNKEPAKGGAKPPAGKPAEGEKGSPDDTVAILALFADDGYYSELFTERNLIGQVKDKLKISFDQEKDKEIAFVNNPPGQDKHWRWQYLEDSSGLLDLIRKKKEIAIAFSNGTRAFNFAVPLTGSTKALTALKQCADGKSVKPAAVKTDKPGSKSELTDGKTTDAKSSKKGDKKKKSDTGSKNSKNPKSDKSSDSGSKKPPVE